MTLLFLDTSFVIALELKDEKYHQTARAHLDKAFQGELVHIGCSKIPFL